MTLEAVNMNENQQYLLDLQGYLVIEDALGAAEVAASVFLLGSDKGPRNARRRDARWPIKIRT